MDIELSKQFGRDISRKAADELYSRFFEIKKRAAGKIKAALVDDDEAIRYHCGRRDRNPVEEDLFFYFDKDSLTKIMSKINVGEADGMVIVHAARGYEKPEDGVDDGEESGRPTLMLFPFKNETSVDTNGRSISSIVHLLDDGREHPGTGGKGRTTTDINNSTNRPNGIPNEVDPVDVHMLPDQISML